MIDNFFKKRYSIRLVWLLVLVLLLAFSGLFIFLKYFLGWQTRESVDYTSKVVLVMLAFLTLIYHMHNLENQIETQKKSNRQNLAKYTYDICSDFRKPMMMDINEDIRQLMISQGNLLQQRSTIPDFVAFIDNEENCRFRKALIVTLNYFESISAMILAGDLDNDIVKRLFGKLFGKYYNKLQYYIDHIQQESPKSWKNYERIVKKWREDESN